MKITTYDLDDVKVLVLDGGLGYDNHRVFREQIQPITSQPKAKLVVDLQRVSYLSSWGIGSLLSLATSVRRNGGDVAFASLHGGISEVIHMMRLNTVFDLYDSVEEAARVLRQRGQAKE